MRHRNCASPESSACIGTEKLLATKDRALKLSHLPTKVLDIGIVVQLWPSLGQSHQAHRFLVPSSENKRLPPETLHSRRPGHACSTQQTVITA